MLLYRTDAGPWAHAAQIEALCAAEGTSLFETMAQAEVYETEDPLYVFATGTLAHTASELFAQVMPGEKPYMSASAQWERYATQAEKEEELQGFSDEEREAYLEATKYDEEYPVAMCYVHYTVEYAIEDPAMSAMQRDATLNAVVNGMQAWLDGLGEAEVFADGFEASAQAELDRLIGVADDVPITLHATVQMTERYTDDMPLGG